MSYCTCPEGLGCEHCRRVLREYGKRYRGDTSNRLLILHEEAPNRLHLLWVRSSKLAQRSGWHEGRFSRVPLRSSRSVLYQTCRPPQALSKQIEVVSVINCSLLSADSPPATDCIASPLSVPSVAKPTRRSLHSRRQTRYHRTYPAPGSVSVHSAGWLRAAPHRHR